MTSSNYPTVQYFLLKFCTHVFYVPVSTKGFVEFFLFHLKRLGFCTLVFYIFINNSRSKQNPTHPFVDIIKQKTCAKFQQKILNSMVIEARQSFQFFRQKPGFLKIIEVYLNLCIGFCITWLVLPNYKNIRKNQFQINHASHLKKETLAQVFSCEFCEISRNTFFTESLWTAASGTRRTINSYPCLLQIFQ